MTNAWLSDKEQLVEEIRSLVCGAKRLRLAVAFWGRDPIGRLGLDRLLGGKVQIICNLASGGTNPDAIEELLKHGCRVKQLDDLHAKSVFV